LPYFGVMLALLLGSITGVWRFPGLWPQAWTLDAWATVQTSPAVLRNTLSLGLASASLGLLWAVAWLELLPPRWDARLRPIVYLPLVLPAVLWVVGVHGIALRLGLDSQWGGVLMAHTVAVMPYSLIALSPAYQGFDARLWHSASSLGASRWRFLWRVKWPLLRAALASAFAVSFAVSVAQYLPTLYVGGGRLGSVTTEAVTLASGGQRSLSAAFALMQWLIPALGFALATWLGKPRWRPA
jgi:putative thiamine transport system permease protein